MLLHRNSCLLLFIKMGQTVEITLRGGGGGDTTRHQNLEDISKTMLVRYFVSKTESFLTKYHTCGI